MFSFSLFPTALLFSPHVSSPCFSPLLYSTLCTRLFASSHFLPFLRLVPYSELFKAAKQNQPRQDQSRCCLFVFSCACSLIRPHCLGCPFRSPHLKALGSATQEKARDRDSRAALGNPPDKRQIRQTYSGRSSRVATRPESQAAPSHTSIFRDDCHLLAMARLTSSYARCCLFVLYRHHRYRHFSI